MSQKLTRRDIASALVKSLGNKTQAARRLEISRKKLRYWIDKYQMESTVEAILEVVEFMAKSNTKTEDVINAEKKAFEATDKLSRMKSNWKDLVKQAHMVDRVVNSVEPHLDRISPTTPEPMNIKGSDGTPMTIVLPINDWHFGKVFEKEVMHDMNAYNPDIAVARMERMAYVVGQWVQNYALMGNPVERIVIPAIGDNGNGNLHPEDEDNYADPIVQMIDFALIVSYFLRDISALGDIKVDVICSAGDNHSRLTKKSATSAKALGTTLNTVFNTYLDLLTEDLDNVEVAIERTHQVYFQVYTDTIGACHGNLLKGGGGQLGIPAYGVKRHHDASVSETVIMAKRKFRELKFDQNATLEDKIDVMSEALQGIVDYNIIAHFHTENSFEFNGGTTFLVPSPMGVDPYAKDALRKFGNPRVSMFAFHRRRGLICRHTIDMADITEGSENPRYPYGFEQSESPSMTKMKNNWIDRMAAVGEEDE